MNIFDFVLSSSRAATTPASPSRRSGNCKATYKYKLWNQEWLLLHRGSLQGKTSWSPYTLFKALRPRGAHPYHLPHKITPRPRSFGRPIPREVSYHSLICPHPLTPQVADKSDDSFQLVYSVQIRKRSEQPRGARLPLQRRLCGTAECRLHDLGWREAAVSSFGQLQASRPQKGPPMRQ